MLVNSIKTKNNFHNYIVIKQSDNTSAIEILLCGANGSILSDLNQSCTLTILDEVDQLIRQKTTEQIVNGTVTFRVTNDLKTNPHTLEITTSDGQKFPSNHDFKIFVSYTHDESELRVINNLSREEALAEIDQSVKRFISENTEEYIDKVATSKWLYENNFKPKEPVATFLELPKPAELKELRGVIDENAIYIYDGAEWIKQSQLNFDGLGTTNQKIEEVSSDLNQKFQTQSIGVFATNIRETDLPRIKNLGVNYIIYVCYETDLSLISQKVDLCNRYGLNVLLSVSQRIHKNTTNDDQLAMDMINAVKSKSNIIGFYLFDEPDLNGISIQRQDDIYDKARALTKLPLFISATTADTNIRLSNKFDYYFIDSYPNKDAYAQYKTDPSSTFESLVGRLLPSCGYVGIEKCIPSIGFFNDSTTYTVTDQEFLMIYYKELLAFFKNQGYVMYFWGDSTDNCLRNSENLYNSALRFNKFNGTIARGNATYLFSHYNEPMQEKINKMLSAYSPMSKNVAYGINSKGWTATGFYMHEGASLIIDLGKIATDVFLVLHTTDGSGVNVLYNVYAGLVGNESVVYRTTHATHSTPAYLRGIKSRYLRIEIADNALSGKGTTYNGYVVIRALSFVAR